MVLISLQGPDMLLDHHMHMNDELCEYGFAGVVAKAFRDTPALEM